MVPSVPGARGAPVAARRVRRRARGSAAALVTGLKDPVITPTLHRWYETRATDIAFEHVPGVGHWIVEEAHDLVLGRRTFLKE